MNGALGLNKTGYKMMGVDGYIYIRTHPGYDKEDCCKLGIASNIPDRDSQYATGEIKRGVFQNVYEVPSKQMRIIERLLQHEYLVLNIKYDGGTEFYNKKIIDLIEPYFISNKIKYRKLTIGEIGDLLRCNRVRKIVEKINIRSVIQVLKSKRTYNPRDYQIDIVKKSAIHFQRYDKGILALICGVGKTLISLWIARELNIGTFLVGVPNILLLEQWKETINILFPNSPCLIVCSGIDTDDITLFLENNNEKSVVITTYASSYKVYDATREIDFVFDMKINDEVHHLTSNDLNTEGRTYVNMLKIKSTKQLSLTATLKILENQENGREEEIIVSNDNNVLFGEIIDRKCLLWAINAGIICDYVIQTIVTDEEQLEHQLVEFNIANENDKRMFLSAFASLKSINDGYSHRLLIYSNNKENSLKLIKYIQLLLENKYFHLPDLYFSEYNSDLDKRTQKKIITDFEHNKECIITCVYCLGEGWDCPLLDGVVFSENMTSNIRIVQSALRASRKNKKDTNKKTKIILPVLNRDDWTKDKDNSDLKKVREVIYQMGLEDETINQKIKVCNISIEKTKPNKVDHELVVDGFGEHDNELTQKLRLQTIKRASLGTTYEKAKKIILEKNIKTKPEYFELCENDNRLPTDPYVAYTSWAGWVDFLSTKREYYELKTCKDKVNEYMISYPALGINSLDLSNMCSDLCKLDPMFPPNGLWVDYYNINELGDIINIVIKKKKTRIVL